MLFLWVECRSPPGNAHAENPGGRKGMQLLSRERVPNKHRWVHYRIAEGPLAVFVLPAVALIVLTCSTSQLLSIRGSHFAYFWYPGGNKEYKNILVPWMWKICNRRHSPLGGVCRYDPGAPRRDSTQGMYPVIVQIVFISNWSWRDDLPSLYDTCFVNFVGPFFWSFFFCWPPFKFKAKQQLQVNKRPWLLTIYLQTVFVCGAFTSTFSSWVCHLDPFEGELFTISALWGGFSCECSWSWWQSFYSVIVEISRSLYY